MDGAWRDGKPGEPPEPATLLVVDRLDDLAPALLHELVYSVRGRRAIARSTMMAPCLLLGPAAVANVPGRAFLSRHALQAMVTDLLHHTPSTVFEFSYPDKKGRKDFSVLLDEVDPVWRTLR